MTLDIATLVFLNIALGFGLGLLFYSFSTLQAGVRGARLWGAAMLTFGAGYSALYLHTATQTAALFYVGWLGVLISVLLMYRAINRICDIDEPRTLFGVVIVSVALCAWGYFTLVAPNPLGRAGTVSILASVVAARAAWDLWVRFRGYRSSAPATTMVVLLCAMALTPILDLSRRWVAGGVEMPGEFGLPIVVVGWTLSLIFIAICVLWLEFSQLYRTMENAGMYDVLTGLGNRQAIMAEVESEHSRSDRARAAFSIALFEVHGFETLANIYGPEGADKILKWAAEKIRKNIRPYDKVGRYGGATFLLLMPNTSDKAESITSRIKGVLQSQACAVAGKTLSIKLHSGIALGERGTPLPSVFKHAEEALATAKVVDVVTAIA